MSEKTLKEKTTNALIWNLLDKGGQQVILLIVGIIVANILSVEDYALVGMLAIFSAIANIVLDSGFSSALIRKQDADDLDFSSVFYFNLIVSIALYVVLFFSAPLISIFFNQPQLTALARVLFLALPLNSLSLIQTTILNKKVQFKKLAKINVVSLLLSAVFSLSMAHNGMGVWTLTWQPVFLAFVRSFLLWIDRSWYPQRRFSMRRIKNMFGFASGLLLASLVNSVFNNIYFVAVGKIYPTKQMGFYTQGNKLSLMVISSVYSSLQTATYSIFSQIQNDRERTLRAYRKTIRFTSFLTFPLMIGLISVFPSLVSLILRADWAGCVPFFQLTCLAGIFTILISINQNFIKVHGRSDVVFKLEIVRTLLIIGSILLTLRQSALTMILAQTITQFVIYLISIIYIGRVVGYHWIQQLKDISPYVLLSVIMWVLLLIPDKYITSNIILLFSKIIIGMVFYYYTNKWLGSQILNEVRSILFKKKKQHRS